MDGKDIGRGRGLLSFESVDGDRADMELGFALS